MIDRYKTSRTLKLRILPNFTIDLLDLCWIIYLFLMSAHYSIPKVPMISILLLTFVSILALYRSNGMSISYVRNGFLSAYFFFMSFVFASKIWALYNRVQGAEIESEMLRLIMLLFCIYVYIDSHERLYKMLKIFIIATTYFAIVYLVTSPLSTYGTTAMGGITDIWRNTASYIGAFAGVMGIHLYTVENKRLCKLLWMLCLIICFVLTLCTGSRKGIIQIALYIGLFVIFQKGMKKRIKSTILLAIVVSIGIYIIVNNDILTDAYIDRMQGLFDTNADDGSVAERTYFKDVAMRLFNMRPICGAGIDAVRSYLSTTGFFHVTYSHSNISELLACYGIVGFVLYYWKVIWSIFVAFKERYRNTFMLTAFTLLCTMVICDYGMMSYYIRQVVLSMAIIIRGIEVEKNIYETVHTKNSDKTEGKREIRSSF